MQYAWILENPKLRRAPKAREIFEYFYTQYYIHDRPIAIGQTTLGSILEIGHSSVESSLKYLLNNDLIIMVEKGNNHPIHHKPSIYKLNEEVIPPEYRVQHDSKSEVFPVEALSNYISSLNLREDIKHTLLEWLELKQPTFSMGQLKAMLKDLQNFCKVNGVTDWDQFAFYVNRTYTHGWIHFLYDSDYKEKKTSGSAKTLHL